MLIHGGSDVTDPQQTRNSYVVHYTPPGASVHERMVGPFSF